MTILEDSTKLSKAEAWKKWEGISYYDMRPREEQFLRLMVSKTVAWRLDNLSVFCLEINEALRILSLFRTLCFEADT